MNVFIIYKVEEDDKFFTMATLNKEFANSKLKELNANHDRQKQEMNAFNKKVTLAMKSTGFSQKWKEGQLKWAECVSLFINKPDAIYFAVKKQFQAEGFTTCAADDKNWQEYAEATFQAPDFDPTVPFYELVEHKLQGSSGDYQLLTVL